MPSGSGLEEAANALVFAGLPKRFGLAIVDGRAPDPAVTDEFAATRSSSRRPGPSFGDRRPVGDSRGGGRGRRLRSGGPATPVVDATLVAVLDGPAELQNDYGLAIFPAALLDAADMGVSATQMGVALTPGSTIDDSASSTSWTTPRSSG